MTDKTTFKYLKITGTFSEPIVYSAGAGKTEGTLFQNEDEKARLSKITNLTNITFDHCTFNENILKNKLFENCTFSNCTFNNINLFKTRFFNTDLSTVTFGATHENFNGMMIDKNSKIPDSAPEFLKQLHAQASKEGGTGFAIFKEGIASACDKDGNIITPATTTQPTKGPQDVTSKGGIGYNN